MAYKYPKLEEILNRAKTDKEYRKQLLSQPYEVLKDVGMTEEEMENVVGGLGSKHSAAATTTCSCSCSCGCSQQ